ncbi:HERV-H LTR-associating protein 2 isoform X2 [Vombatus ursinus]|uniref:HERV-H LTR-associating protein 2 isoform X2 n=1 Tax=Vombatus ursinus TaxID=29139 RepID=UPI000FFD7BF2|nr:HERV-H LTR-associating protein 2 isoform X2 [Vombatus ursinus]
MKVQSLLNLYLLTVLVQPLIGFDDGFPSPYFNRLFSQPMTTVVGRLYEDVILPCSFEKGHGIVIHWQKEGKLVHSYYRESDHLEQQEPDYAKRTSLFLNEINNGNASLELRRLNLQDEGVYTCYAATVAETKHIEVELKLGAFITPVMEYQEQNGDDYLTCYLFGAHPLPTITWTANNATSLESNIEVLSHPLFSVKSQLNITGSNSSYQCIIENLVLNQRWIGKWKTEGTLLTTEGKKVLFPCKLKNEDFSPEKSITVSWYRVENSSSTILASFSSSSSRVVFDNRFTWTKDMTQEKYKFSLTLMSPTPSNNGKYLCNISSVNYTELTVQPLTVEPSQGNSFNNTCIILWAILAPGAVVLGLVGALIYWKKNCNSNSSPTGEQEERESMNLPICENQHHEALKQ